MGRPSSPLSAHLPPLIMGTATFNSQYNHDPYALPTTDLVHRALTDGVRAFDTSPYYGPAEELLGRALASEAVRTAFPRHTYQILTKVGRIASSSFDYSPRWVRHSIRRSLQRLHTDYLDAVYCHDVEFVSRAEALDAVRELRRIRDTEGTIRYVGISGYPVDVLCEIAELVLRETGEPLDIVQSYANFTLQNTKLLSQGLPRLVAAGVDVVPNASPLGMGLLRKEGVPIGSMGDFHPAPDGLRNAVLRVGAWTDNQMGEKLEVIAIRFALERWLRDGAKVGARGLPLARAPNADPSLTPVTTNGTGERLGVSVMGVSNLGELDETLRVWRSIVDGLDSGEDEQPQSSAGLKSEGLVSDRISSLAQQVQAILGSEWVDYTWASPGSDFVNSLPADHLSSLEEAEEAAAKARLGAKTFATQPVQVVNKTTHF
ncbi:D-arabinose 1-dehydrogenase (NAD(P)(+)) ARA2 [Aspergillus saccharolyticus JOP 1030-1]|uniref:Putative L-galactose dehydrogenase (L-GalDH) n=1 Tax=Aspergillus saccharolyticus JOP 1030-1 TaxID=1450539 RepID=A0A318Z8C5_9EURO|nr:putative L-galactose dehydrogenase (L-GalDH) [Aspergillus saccharolyticus JOP 1030-1]PYH43409.1 putative L-galactose dehydrogenase (L-GalDH) [Aspergillus saccharolyticus JOP 1030-1]